MKIGATGKRNGQRCDSIFNSTRILIKKPVLAISAILIRPLPKMIALGGVAMGSMKAQEAEMVAGIIISKGFS